MPQHLEDAPRHGRKSNQKLKAYLVMQYLLKHADENHAIDAYELCGYLKEVFDIDAERRSIYTDVAEINKVMWLQENGGTIEDAEEAIEGRISSSATRMIGLSSSMLGASPSS